jgi:cytochrome bd ubiquinol oxidase subunit II
MRDCFGTRVRPRHFSSSRSAWVFSALYLALLMILVALMARGVAFEFKGKSENPRWRATWRRCTTLGSLLAPLLIGVGLGDLLVGLPIDSAHEYTGNFFNLLTPYGLWTGLTILGLCLLHGSTFLMLKTTDDVHARARAASRPLVWAAVGLVLGFVIWTRVVEGHTQVPGPIEALAVIAVIFAARLARSDRHKGWAFGASATAIASVVGSIFIDLYPT